MSYFTLILTVKCTVVPQEVVALTHSMSGVWVVKSVGFNGGRSQQYFQFHWDFHNSKAGAFDNSSSGSFWSIECWNIIIRYDDSCIASYCIFLPRDTYIQSKLSRINFATQDMNQDVYYKDLFTIVCMIILPFQLL